MDNDAVKLRDYQNKNKFDLEDAIGMSVYHLKHLTQILIEVSDDDNQRDIITSLIHREANELHVKFNQYLD